MRPLPLLMWGVFILIFAALLKLDTDLLAMDAAFNTRWMRHCHYTAGMSVVAQVETGKSKWASATVELRIERQLSARDTTALYFIPSAEHCIEGLPWTRDPLRCSLPVRVSRRVGRHASKPIYEARNRLPPLASSKGNLPNHTVRSTTTSTASSTGT